jgi:hypothetical protein
MNQALDLFEATRGDYLESARAAARKLLVSKYWITIDDVRKVCPPPEGVDPRVMGAVFNKADYESLGWINSTRPECHRRPVQRFRLKKAELPKSAKAFWRRNQEAQ